MIKMKSQHIVLGIIAVIFGSLMGYSSFFGISPLESDTRENSSSDD